MGEINTVRGKWRLRGLSAVRETADSSDFEQIKGMLPHAGLPVLGNADFADCHRFWRAGARWLLEVWRFDFRGGTSPHTPAPAGTSATCQVRRMMLPEKH